MRLRYDEKFRKEAVRLALTGEKPVVQTAQDLGIKESTLYNWISEIRRSELSPLPDDKKLSAAEMVDELTRLRKENARLKEEREILKKAAAFFAKEEQNR